MRHYSATYPWARIRLNVQLNIKPSKIIKSRISDYCSSRSGLDAQPIRYRSPISAVLSAINIIMCIQEVPLHGQYFQIFARQFSSATLDNSSQRTNNPSEKKLNWTEGIRIWQANTRQQTAVNSGSYLLIKWHSTLCNHKIQSLFLVPITSSDERSAPRRSIVQHRTCWRRQR